MPRETCASALVDSLDEAGIALILPVQWDHERRVKPEDDAWLTELFQAARAVRDEADVETRWWWIREARGSGGELPCIAGPTAIGGDLNRRAGDRGG